MRTDILVASATYHLTIINSPGSLIIVSPAKEIEEYLRRLCEDEHMKEEIKLEHEIVGAHWNEETALWKVTVKSIASGIVFDDHCDFLLNASGILK